MVVEKLTKLHGEIQVLKTKENQINDNIDKKNLKIHIQKHINTYLERIKRDGVPYDLISKSLPTVEECK